MPGRGIMLWIAAGFLACTAALIVTLTPGAEEPARRGAATFTAARRPEVALSPKAAPPSPAPPSHALTPLQRSPGYYLPADPESASVRLGRREAPEVPYLFEGGAASMDEFGRLVVAALSAQDVPALHSLRVTFGEFDIILWREFPESRPVTNIQAEDAWSLSEPRSQTAVNRATGLYGGRRLRYLTVEVGRVQTFTNFVLHRDVRILAVDETTTRIERIKIAPSVAERKGRFKALLYRD